MSIILIDIINVLLYVRDIENNRKLTYIESFTNNKTSQFYPSEVIELIKEYGKRIGNPDLKLENWHNEEYKHNLMMRYDNAELQNLYMQIISIKKYKINLISSRYNSLEVITKSLLCNKICVSFDHDITYKMNKLEKIYGINTEGLRSDLLKLLIGPITKSSHKQYYTRNVFLERNSDEMFPFRARCIAYNKITKIQKYSSVMHMCWELCPILMSKKSGKRYSGDIITESGNSIHVNTIYRVMCGDKYYVKTLLCFIYRRYIFPMLIFANTNSSDSNFLSMLPYEILSRILYFIDIKI